MAARATVEMLAALRLRLVWRAVMRIGGSVRLAAAEDLHRRRWRAVRPVCGRREAAMPVQRPQRALGWRDARRWWAARSLLRQAGSATARSVRVGPACSSATTTALRLCARADRRAGRPAVRRDRRRAPLGRCVRRARALGGRRGDRVPPSERVPVAPRRVLRLDVWSPAAARSARLRLATPTGADRLPPGRAQAANVRHCGPPRRVRAGCRSANCRSRCTSHITSYRLMLLRSSVVRRL